MSNFYHSEAVFKIREEHGNIYVDVYGEKEDGDLWHVETYDLSTRKGHDYLASTFLNLKESAKREVEVTVEPVLDP